MDWMTATGLIAMSYFLLCVIFYFTQDLYFFRPETLPKTFQYRYPFPFEEVHFDMEDGGYINGLHFKVPNARGVVYYLKGNSRSVKGWGKFARDFVSKGYDFFMVDYRGMGKSSGKRTEATLFLANDREAFDLDDDGLKRRAARLFGEASGRVIEALRRFYPEATPSDLYILAHTGFLRYPIDSIKLAERKAARAAAPVYLYKFEWPSPARWGKMRTPHALEIPFVFDNVALGGWQTLTRSTPDAFALAAQVSATWAAFARTGDPNSGDLPRWSPYRTPDRATMVINSESALVNDPAQDERLLWESVFYPSA